MDEIEEILKWRYLNGGRHLKYVDQPAALSWSEIQTIAKGAGYEKTASSKLVKAGTA
jgi:hypothetical protein